MHVAGSRSLQRKVPKQGSGTSGCAEAKHLAGNAQNDLRKSYRQRHNMNVVADG